MDNIKVSIIIPIYNVEKYLRECLESVVNQTLKEIEIICVNDGSPDNSLSIIEEYAKKDNRIVVVNKENGGYASAINKGLEIARGEFIQIVESDDYCALNMCEETYNKIKNTDADYAVSDFYYLKKGKTRVSTYLNEEEKKLEFFNLKTIPRLLMRAAYPWKNLYRKEFLQKHNIRMYQDGYGTYEDQPWNATILSKAEKIIYINKPFYYYRIDADGSSTNFGGRKMINYIKRRSQVKEILEQAGMYNDEVKEYFCSASVGGCLFFFKRISFDYKEEYYNEMKKFLQNITNDKIDYRHFSKKALKRYKKIMKLDYSEFYRFNILKHKISKFLTKGSK